MSGQFVPGLSYESTAQQLWALIVEAMGEWEARVNQAASGAGLSPIAAWTLVQLDPDHPISQRELAQRRHCDPSSVVDSADRLEERGLVRRQVNPSDRRVNVLVVTSKGRRVRDKLIDRLFQPPDSLRHIPERDQARLRDVMLAALAAQLR
jgi:DNA-binding MarR family transcriptional regulator